MNAGKQVRNRPQDNLALSQSGSSTQSMTTPRTDGTMTEEERARRLWAVMKIVLSWPVPENTEETKTLQSSRSVSVK